MVEDQREGGGVSALGGAVSDRIFTQIAQSSELCIAVDNESPSLGTMRDASPDSGFIDATPGSL